MRPGSKSPGSAHFPTPKCLHLNVRAFWWVYTQGVRTRGHVPPFWVRIRTKEPTFPWQMSEGSPFPSSGFLKLRKGLPLVYRSMLPPRTVFALFLQAAKTSLFAPLPPRFKLG